MGKNSAEATEMACRCPSLIEHGTSVLLGRCGGGIGRSLRVDDGERRALVEPGTEFASGSQHFPRFGGVGDVATAIG